MVATLTLQAVPDLLAGAERRLTAPATCVVGRGTDCDLQLSEGVFTWRVSRRHCRIDVTPRGVFVRDLGSRNGTFLNGANIGQRPRGQPAAADSSPGPGHALTDGDVLGVGDLSFRVRIAADATAPEGACRQTAGAG
jgi:pSer/pThr/pTyr-binding forkhead associated (FHA) protein